MTDASEPLFYQAACAHVLVNGEIEFPHGWKFDWLAAKKNNREPPVYSCAFWCVLLWVARYTYTHKQITHTHRAKREDGMLSDGNKGRLHCTWKGAHARILLWQFCDWIRRPIMRLLRKHSESIIVTHTQPKRIFTLYSIQAGVNSFLKVFYVMVYICWLSWLSYDGVTNLEIFWCLHMYRWV